ncbi:5-bromo-4-chloroindolyl phosphate hydrolysis family protein [uncultured Brachyspira sp.]|uniref:5-bromo-4-chloroindolyl phosphate hydrolysis family protein n=1 Tax=uncultured Brachyspira sp. TaxID=221953 RepID=UPI002626AE56|nr:5-bromo-4-chloroindolyl phosphate hydrolysis family protein [uncultured Brachyspira sp.]
MARDEDDIIFQKLRQNVQRNFPREDDKNNYSMNNYKTENYSNKDSLIILETQRNIEKITDLSKKIDDAELTPALKEMISILEEMVNYSKANKEGEKKLEKINEYHLPTAVKMLNSYIDFCNFPVKNANMEKTAQEIENVIIKLNEALKSMLVEMNQNKLMDINSDIDVLKTMLEKDGL